MGGEAWRHGVAQRGGRGRMGLWWVKIRRVTLGVSNPSPRADFIAQGSSVRKIKPHNFWL